MKPSEDLATILVYNMKKDYLDQSIENYYFSKRGESVVIVINLVNKYNGIKSQIEFAIGNND